MTPLQKLQVADLAVKVAKVFGSKLYSYEALLLPSSCSPGVSLVIRFQEPPPPPPPKITKGTVVRLKSGGPKMTVSAIRSNIGVVCNWFSEGGTHSGVFQPATLEVVS